MRKKVMAGNWKMNKTLTETKELIGILKPLTDTNEREVVFCVPFVSMMFAVEAVADTNIAIGAQNMHYEDQGAYTGEISAKMLTDIGVRYVIIGHSERRQYFNETNEIVNKKIHRAFASGLTPIICCGETLEQREEGITVEFITEQIERAFSNVSAADAVRGIVAYEPIWAIGTGKVATSEQAEEICAAVRKVLGRIYNEEVAENIRILYGGSVNSKNAAQLFACENIDGALVGGASLSEDFAKIVNYEK